MANTKISELPITTSLDAEATVLVKNVVGWVDTTQQILASHFPWIGTVTSVSVTTANGVSATTATATTTPAHTFTLWDITPSSATLSGLTASEIVATDASKKLQSLAVSTYPSLTELAYVKWLTSAIQWQINGKAATDQTMYIGTTAVDIDRTTAALTLAGITLTTPDIWTPSAWTLTNCDGTASSLTAWAVTNATLTTALTVNTGTLTLTADAGNDSVLTIWWWAASVSGANTGDNSANSLYSWLAASKQDTLVSNTNIKTVNSTTILGSWDIDTTQTTITGNAWTATILETARAIAGVSFDGSAPISLNNNAITNGAWYTTNTWDVTATGTLTAETFILGNGTTDVKSGTPTYTSATQKIWLTNYSMEYDSTAATLVFNVF